MKRIVLASSSAARQNMLKAAGVEFEHAVSSVDEAVIKTRALKGGAAPRELAGILAEHKAIDVSARLGSRPDVLVIGADQTLELEGRSIDKAGSVEQLRGTLQAMVGRTHALHSAVAVVRDGALAWTQTNTALMTMRALSSEFMEGYVARHGEAVRSSLGGYWYEGEGVQLFDAVEGDYFTILGLPLIPLLGFLRREGAMPT